LSAYDRALVQRGSLTIWISEEALATWAYQGPRRRGVQLEYSDQTIEAILALKEIFHVSNRAAEGLVRSVFALLQVALSVPDHTTLSRHGRTVQIRLPRRACGPLHIVIDSSGLKVLGEGEWKVRQHGGAKRRTWRKTHLSVGATSGEVQTAMLSTASVSDGEGRATAGSNRGAD
jgi:hypothetical protein